MTCYVVTEKESDATLLKERIEADRWDGVVVVAQGTKMRAISFAKTVSINEATPAAVVLNSLTDDEDELQLMRSEFQDLVAPLPPEITPVLLLATPSIDEAIDSDVMPKLDRFLSGEEDLASFRYVPRP